MLARARIDAMRSDERGLTTAEWVILIGVVAALAVTVGAIMTQRIVDKANNTPGL